MSSINGNSVFFILTITIARPPKCYVNSSMLRPIEQYRTGNLAGLHQRVRSLACPARFERATYALEEFVAAEKSLYFNGLHA